MKRLMMHDDREYYEARAEQQLRLAQESENPSAVQAHYQMAHLYLDRIHGDVPDKPPPLIWGLAQRPREQEDMAT